MEELELKRLWAGAFPWVRQKLPPWQGWAEARRARAGDTSSPGMSEVTALAGVGWSQKGRVGA